MKVIVARGSAPGGGNCEVLSTDAGCAGGPACSSDEAAVMAVELVNTNVEGGSGLRWRALLEAVLYE